MTHKKRKARSTGAWTYAQALKNLRYALSTESDDPVSQAHLAKVLGVALSTITKWEQSRRQPRGLYKEKVDRLLKRHGLLVPHP